MKTLIGFKALLFLAGALSGLLALAFLQPICDSRRGPLEVFSWILKREHTSPGYILIVSNRPTLGAHLVDVDGLVLHSWKLSEAPGRVYLDEELNLWAAFQECSRKEIVTVCRFREIVQFDWSGTKLQKFKLENIHHDFELIGPNKIATLQALPLFPKKDGAAVYKHPQCPYSELWDERIVEINSDGDLVWTWSFYEAFKEMAKNHTEITCGVYHANSIRYISKDPFYQEPAYLISARHNSQVFMVSRKTGQVIWSAPKGLFKYQHDARLLESGNILVFSNFEGELFHSQRDYTPFSYSSHTQLPYSLVIEINPLSNKVQWVFESVDPSKPFFSPIISGAHELKNGNIFITEGVRGHLLEVKKETNTVVYSALVKSDKGASPQAPWPGASTFKAMKYSSTKLDDALRPGLLQSYLCRPTRSLLKALSIAPSRTN